MFLWKEAYPLRVASSYREGLEQETGIALRARHELMCKRGESITVRRTRP